MREVEAASLGVHVFGVGKVRCTFWESRIRRRGDEQTQRDAGKQLWEKQSKLPR